MGDWRLVYNPDRIEPNDKPEGAYPIPELALFDLELYPKEQRNVRAEHPEVVERLLLDLQEWRAARRQRAAAPFDDEQAQRAEDLGYLGSSGKGGRK